MGKKSFVIWNYFERFIIKFSVRKHSFLHCSNKWSVIQTNFLQLNKPTLGQIFIWGILQNRPIMGQIFIYKISQIVPTLGQIFIHGISQNKPTLGQNFYSSFEDFVQESNNAFFKSITLFLFMKFKCMSYFGKPLCRYS